jgi:VWFA-related protein
MKLLERDDPGERLEIWLQNRQLARAHPSNDFRHHGIGAAQVGDGSFHLKDNHIEMRKLFTSYLAALLTVALAANAQQPAAPAQEPQDQVIKVDVDLVNILFSVKTKKGELIPNLEKNNFTLREDGKEQTISRFSRETDLPLTLGLLIDISASQERLIDIERDAASQFFSSVIRSKDQAFLISFGKDTQLLQDFTSSPRQLIAGMRDLRGDGGSITMGRSPIPVNTGPFPDSSNPKGTLLYDAVYLASTEKLKNEVGRKALILITDGEDQGSTYSIKDAIEKAQKSDAIVFSIYYVDKGFYSRGGLSFGAGGNEGALKKISDETGGHVFTVSGKHPLSEVFKEIQEELRNQYSIGYTPTNATRDGSFRHIEIKTDNSDYHVQARAGYYATKNDAQ